MPDPVGTGGVVEKGKVDAHTWMDKELKGIQTEYDNAVEDAFTTYLEETSNGRGAGIFDINTRLEKRKEFAIAITNAVETADRSELPKSLQRVADAQSRHNARVLNVNRRRNGTPYRLPKGTPASSCIGSARVGPGLSI
ncbi:hypothetical protein OK142_06645 [Agrobacterium sp. BT-220-3]|nr:hypothetical protein [Agrobacterium sp. BT-220-3]